jgi:hypothetical protein
MGFLKKYNAGISLGKSVNFLLNKPKKISNKKGTKGEKEKNSPKYDKEMPRAFEEGKFSMSGTERNIVEALLPKNSGKGGKVRGKSI